MQAAALDGDAVQAFAAKATKKAEEKFEAEVAQLKEEERKQSGKAASPPTSSDSDS